MSADNYFFTFLLHIISVLIQIEEASREDLKVENWALIMEICDIINTTEEGPQHAAKAIRRK